MITWINSWMKGIIIAVIISTIIEMIIPNGNIKKYIKTVIGIYIMFVIISPIITKVTGKDISIEKYINSQSEKYKTKEVSQIDTNYYITKTYIENIKADVIKELEAKGYKVNEIKIEIEEEDTKYGKLKTMKLEVSKLKKGIEKVEISTNKSESKTQEIPDTEKNLIRTFLADTYGLEQNNIVIN